MKKLIPLVAVVALASCRHAATGAPTAAPRPAATPGTGASAAGVAGSAATPAGGNMIGASDAAAAVNDFLKAAKSQDIQTMSSLFGGPTGLLREIETKDNVERRLLTMMCYLKHDSYKMGQGNASTGGARVFAVDLTLGKSTLSTNFTAVPNANGRWFVEVFDLPPLTPHCTKS